MVATPSTIWANTAAVVASIGSRRACNSLRIPDPDGKSGRKNGDDIGQGAVQELGCQRVLKKIDIPRRVSVEPWRDDFTIHERPCVRGVPRFQTRHERPRDDLQIDETREYACPEFGQQGRRSALSLSSVEFPMERASQKA